MPDDYRDEDKLDRLGDPSPPTPRCTRCRGLARVKGRRCPECDGGSTREAQRAHMAKLVACAAAERPAGLTRVMGLINATGQTILEFGKLKLSNQDVLVWHHSGKKKTPGELRELCREMQDCIEPEARPAAILAVPHGDRIDAFRVGSDVSSEGIHLGLMDSAKEIGETLARPTPSASRDLASLGVAVQAGGLRNILYHYLWDDPDGEMRELKAILAEHKLELSRKKTFHELIREADPGTLLRHEPTDEYRKRVSEALDDECLKVIDTDSAGLFQAISDALAMLRQTDLTGRFICIHTSKKSHSRMGVNSTFQGIIVNSISSGGRFEDDRILVSATIEGEYWDPSHVVVIRWEHTGSPVLDATPGEAAEVERICGRCHFFTDVGDGKAYSADWRKCSFPLTTHETTWRLPTDSCADNWKARVAIPQMEEETIACRCGHTFAVQEGKTQDKLCSSCDRYYRRNLKGRWHHVKKVGVVVAGKILGTTPRHDRAWCGCGSSHEMIIKDGMEELFQCSCGRDFKLLQVAGGSTRWEVTG